MEALDFTIFLVLWKRKRMEELGVKTSMFLRNSYSNYLNTYTDGSKNKQESVGIGIHIPEFKIDISKRITDQLSVYGRTCGSHHCTTVG